MLIYILMNVKNLQNIVFSFEIDLNGQNIFLPDCHHSIKPPLPRPPHTPQQDFLYLLPLTLSGKPCLIM